MTTPRSLSWILVAALAVPGVASADPITTHPLKMSLAGGFEFAGEVFKGKATDKDIVQLAQGRTLEDKPPKNEILAVRIDCATGDATIVVWDKDINAAPAAILQTVSNTFSTTDEIATHTKGGDAVFSFSIAEFDFQTLGNMTWGITGGSIEAAAVVKYGDETGSVCPSSLKATVLGTAEITADTESIDLLVIKGKVAAKKPIHIVP